MTESAIDIRGLFKTYEGAGKAGPKDALRGVDLAVPRGAIFGLLGPNGAGKSTLINILAGLVIKTAGAVRIWGFDQDVNPRQSRAAIGVMPQELTLDPFFTPRESLEVQAGLYGVPAAQRQSDRLLEMVELSDKAHAYARTLSGGMRRRLLLAKALVHRPKILVLDEPTAGVDIELRAMLWDRVRELNAEGTTIILTTHYLQEAEEMCDEIAIIDQGRLIAQDSTAALMSGMDQKTLVVNGEGLGLGLNLPPGAEASRRGEGLAITYPSQSVRAEDILAALQASGARIADLRTEEPDLEDVFLALTAGGSSDS